MVEHNRLSQRRTIRASRTQIDVGYFPELERQNLRFSMTRLTRLTFFLQYLVPTLRPELARFPDHV